MTPRPRPARMSEEQTAAWLAPVYAAPTVEALEAAFHVCINNPDGAWRVLSRKADGALRRALAQRGWELVAQDPQGARVPRIVLKPSSFRGTTYQGKSYQSGSWGNGPGYRWALDDLLTWVFHVGAFAKREDARDVIDWVLMGMPHRALRCLATRPVATEGA